MIAQLCRLLLVASLAASSHAQPGPPAGVEILAEAQLGEKRYTLYTGALERNEGRVRAEGQITVFGQLTRVSWRADDEAEPAELIAALRAAIPDAVTLFECSGRDCGRSTLWANHAFGVRQLTGLNDEQHYVAAGRPAGPEQSLHALYAVRHGNGRVFVHVDTLVPEQPLEFNDDRSNSRRLQQTGRTVLRGAVCGLGSACGFRGPEDLKAAQDLVALATSRSVWLVCHSDLPSAGQQAQELLDISRQCAAQLADQVDTRVRPLGVGPLQPIETANSAPVELVVPAWLPTGENP